MSSTGLIVRPVEPELQAEADAHKSDTKASATERAYASDWGQFLVWCEAYGLTALPAEENTIGLYLTALARGYTLDGPDGPIVRDVLGYWSIERAYASIRAMHKRGGHPLPTLPGIKDTFRGIAGKLTKAKKKATPMLASDLLELVPIVSTWSWTMKEVRDWAILLLTFAGALRREELSRLMFDDVRVERGGIQLHLRVRKNDQGGVGTDIAVPWGELHPMLCPVLALKAWLDRFGRVFGPALPHDVQRQDQRQAPRGRERQRHREASGQAPRERP